MKKFSAWVALGVAAMGCLALPAVASASEPGSSASNPIVAIGKPSTPHPFSFSFATPTGSRAHPLTMSSCSGDYYGPYKASSTTVEIDASAVCTADVEEVAGALTLYRGLATPIPMATDSEDEDSNVISWTVSANCGVNTTYYWSGDIPFHAISYINGSKLYDVVIPGVYISC